MSMYAAPHSAMASITGIRLIPVVVSEYSTHGGFSLLTSRRIRPSASSSFSWRLRM